mmetsp:Transcript_22284/g.53442  ORF Transcript_22284/g.53442 Transcript_22284/m.53442 type:complete len:600 (-) Transcript_22284:3659-5458(-)
MVLSVPPLLEELGLEVKATARQALAAWQSELWDAAQRLREQEEPEVDLRWMGTVAQLSSVIGGSVVLGGDGVAPDVVPLSSDAMPTVKGPPEDPLVRLEGPPGLSGRYAQLSVVIGTSVGIWPAVISVGDDGGEDARRLRGTGGRPVVLQVVARSSSRLGFRLVDTETGSVVSVSDSVEEVAKHVEVGPQPVPWAEFLEGRLWGLPASMPAPGDSTTMVTNGPHMRAMASLWGLNKQLLGERVPLLALLGFMAKATELPQARALANELATNWDTLSIDAEKILNGVEQLIHVMLPAAGTSTVLDAAKPARALDAVTASLYMGDVLRRSVLQVTTAVATTQFSALDSPRARRSMAAATGTSTYLTAATPAASPARPRRSPRADSITREVDSDGDEILTPESTRKELKRMQLKRMRQAARHAASEYAEKGKRVARHQGDTARGQAPAGLPLDLVDTRGPTPIGPTMLSGCINIPNMVEVRRLIPESANDTPLRELSGLLSMGGFQGAPEAFAQAASTVPTGIVPVVGTALEAEMLAEHISMVLDDLVLANARAAGRLGEWELRRRGSFNRQARQGATGRVHQSERSHDKFPQDLGSLCRSD